MRTMTITVSVLWITVVAHVASAAVIPWSDRVRGSMTASFMQANTWDGDLELVTRILQHLKITADAPPLSPARACEVDPFWTDDEPWLDESAREHGPTGRGAARSPRAPP